MKRRRANILAFFDHPGASNDLTETNGLPEHLKDTAREDSATPPDHITRYLLDAGGSRPLIHSLLWRAGKPAERLQRNCSNLLAFSYRFLQFCHGFFTKK